MQDVIWKTRLACAGTVLRHFVGFLLIAVPIATFGIFFLIAAIEIPVIRYVTASVFVAALMMKAGSYLLEI